MKLNCMDKLTVLVNGVKMEAKTMRVGRKYAWLAIDGAPGLHKFSLATGKSSAAWEILRVNIETELRNRRKEIRDALPRLSCSQLAEIEKIIANAS